MKSISRKHLDPQYIGPDATLVEAARRMRELDASTLSVCENGRLVGSVSSADVTFRAVARNLNPNTATVREVMTHEAPFCFHDQRVREAGRIMEARQIRRLPVVNHKKRLLGIISLADLALCARKKKFAGEVLAFRFSRASGAIIQTASA
jgi:CBS domain-containing protein